MLAVRSSFRAVLLAAVTAALVPVRPSTSWAQSNSSEEKAKPAARTEQTSLAQQVAQLRRAIEEDKKLLQKLKAELDDPNSTYRKAEEIFQKVDAQREELKRQLEEAKQAGDERKVEQLTEQLGEVEKQWKLARNAFETELRNRRLLQQRIANLTEKIRNDEAALRQLTGEAPPEQPEQNKSSLPAGETAEPAPQQSAEQQPAGSGKAAPSSEEATEEQPESHPEEKTTGPAAEEQRRLAELEKDVQQLERELELVEKRLDVTQRTLEQEREALRSARLRRTNAVQTLMELQQQLREITQARLGETDPARIQSLDRQIQQISAQLQHAEELVRTSTTEVAEQERRVERLIGELDQLARQREDLRQKLAQARGQLEKEQRRVYWLGRLWQLLGLKDWLIEHGPSILLTLLVAVVAWRFVKALERRIADVVLRAGGREVAAHELEERRNRARTLAGFFRHVSHLVIIGVAGIIILGEFGVRLDVLLGGAAITGIAAAFAGQNLLRDYFSGFVILLENQYGVNDVVKIGDLAGVVEAVTLRLTVLRSLDGTVHFIPNGQITAVSNMTHGWSRALFDIEVSYKEDVDRVMEVLLDLAREMRQDPVYGPLILDDPEMLGVDEFRQSGVAIKFFLKTSPLKQWTVKRELQRRIKKKFDELGIEIPYPHRTVYHRLDSVDPHWRLLFEKLGGPTEVDAQDAVTESGSEAEQQS